MSIDIGRRIAHEILQSQTRTPILEQPPEKAGFKEQPQPLSYFYPPHHYETVEGSDSLVLYDLKVPPGHLFHIHQVANNWFEDCFADWKIDGARFERVERWISSINAPLVIKDRFILAYNSVKWIFYNQSDESVIAEVLIDGMIWLYDDWKKYAASAKV